MAGNTNIVGGSGSSGGGGGGGGGTADYATNAGHADTADEATHATNADNATNADYATQAGSASVADKLAENSSDWNKIARKDSAQSIAGVWTFLKGIISTLKSYFNGGIEVTNGTKTDTLQATGNATVGGTLGVTGKLNGHEADFTDVTMDNLGTSSDRVKKTYATDIDAKNIATENLEVTKNAHFFRLVVDELLSNKGAIIISSANCVIERVNTSSSYYEVLFSTVDADGNNVDNSWCVGDQALCLTFRGGAGTFDDVKNRYYWRYVGWVGSVSVDGVAYHAIRLSRTSGQYDGTDAPAAGDNLVQLGYSGSETAYNYRQSATIISSYPTMDSGLTPPSIAFYKGINNFNLTSHRYTYLDGLSNEFIGNFKVLVNGSYQNLATLLVTMEGLISNVQATMLVGNMFGNLTSGWKYLPSGGASRSTTPVRGWFGTSSDFDAILSPNVTLTAGKTYCMSFYSEIDGILVSLYTQNGTLVSNLSCSGVGGGDTFNNQERYYVTFQVQTTDVYFLSFSDSEGQTYLVGMPLLEEGTSPSPAIMYSSVIAQTATDIDLMITSKLGQAGVKINGSTRQIDLIAGKVTFCDSQGGNTDKIWIDPTGGTLHAVNAFLSGSLLCHRMVRRSGSEPYVVCFSGNTAATLALLGDIVVVGGQYSSNLPVRLPPAKFFPGAHIKIVNATYSTSGGNRTEDPSIITLEVVHNDNTEPRAEDVYNVATNSLAVAVPFVAASGSNILYYDYYEYLTYDAYIEVDLVSEPNIYENPTSPTHYVWTVIGAQKG
jgi:hypothetical protein